MYRRGGIAAILAGLVLGILFLLWPVQYQTGWVRSRQDVTRVYVACGTPYKILFAGQFDGEARTPWIQSQCERASRTRVFNIVVFGLPLLVLGGAGLGRGWYRRVPLDQVLRPLPTLVWWKRRPRLQVPSTDADPVDDPYQVEATRESPEGPTPA